MIFLLTPFLILLLNLHEFYLFSFIHVSFKKKSIVHHGNGAGLGGNWPFVQIKSTPSVLVLRKSQMTETPSKLTEGLEPNQEELPMVEKW